ncbi:tRNA pseudouridine(55) synthase TruB [Weissella bombi]|uniref:tRNA pseudouridine synthase B n=1 Tax=Weissella bombi TaxID=1505725 RepID=A0A1C3YNU5_9LACO|nr:tRNA pseudouridine(55) synthase TruB [Weissella bombi]SCB71769.1 tRNA pseudouridine55 synthase [Weissella bombi]
MDGILPIYKEAGMTSHDVVSKLRRILNMKKIGHAGTLDPSVDGVLPIALGKATKTIEFLQEAGKTYTGSVTLGFATTTEDLDGEVIATKALEQPFSIDEIQTAMASLTGEIVQIPPMYSAVKVNGRRLYDYARAGETVERPHRQATIYEFKLTSDPIFDEQKQQQSFTFIAKVSKGTYIRTLAVDLGKKLGVPSVMSQLTRTSAGGYDFDHAHSISDVAERMAQDGKLGDWLMPIATAVEQFPHVELSDLQWDQVKHGIGQPASLCEPLQDKIVLTYHGEVKSVFHWRSDKNQYRAYRTFSIE